MASPLSQMIQTPLCTFCKEEKITDWICSDCDKPLCYECKRCHLWDFERKDHKIVRAVPLERKDHDIVRAIPLESIAKVKQILKKIRCTNHKDHYYTNYCIECRCLVCPECVSILSIHSRHTFKTINTIHEETLQKLESEEIRIKQNLLTSVTRKLKSLKDWSTFHEKMFEEEKEKILKRADELKKWITECSDDMMNELKQNLVKNANVISQQKVKLEQLQKELKEKINIINKSKVKDDIEQILNDHVDVSNVSINTLHIPLIIPNETKQFSVSKKTKERLIRVRDFFGNFQNYDGTADVECKITNSYNLQGFHSQHKAYYNVYNTSVAVASDGTILIGNRQLLFEMKPDKNPRIKECKPKITDMLFLETNELVFAVEDSHAILLRNNHDKIRTLYTIPEVQNTILALCGNRDGNICILYSRHYTSLIYNRLSMFGTCYIAVISQNGILVRTITCEDKFLESPVPTSGQNIISPDNHSDSHQAVRSRVKQILESKPNGLWSTRFPVEYKERFQEDPPGNLLELVKAWKDLSRVEFNTLTQKEVFYPVKETSPPPVQAIPSPKKDVPVLTQIPFPVQNSSQRKDFKIPQGKTLPLGEKVVVYITYIHSIGCFCVQLEDSPIDEIVDGLAQIDQEPVPSESDLTKGKFVAAMYSTDGSWSRAEILSESPENSVITVLYVDFGNDEKCKSCNTRWLSEKLSTYPVQAIYCTLYGIQPLQGEEDWSKDLQTKFGNIVEEEALVAVTQSYTDDGICEVDLYLKNDRGISINQKLIELGLVRPLEEIVIEDSISEAESEIEPEPLKLPEENEWDVYISFINQSSNSVVLRLVGENYSEKLDEFDNELEKSYQSCTTECSVEVDGLYIALVDELYHRVRVLSIMDDPTIECYFLDHGDTERVNKDQLKTLDPAVNKLLPYQAIEVSLYGLEEIAANPTTVDKLLDLALAKTCVAEIISRDEGLSVILYDTGNDEDVNINEVIATAVMEETEARMMAQGDFQPASISTETSPVKGLSSKSKNLEQALNSLKISQEKIVTSDINEEEEGEEENGDSEGSWETEEEEEVVPVKGAMKKVKDKNSNMVKISTKKNVTTSDVLSNVQKSKSQSPDSEGKNLYTWKKSGQGGEASGVDVDDETSLWVHEEYWKRPLTQSLNIPERGDYIDCHVSKVFDPTNFVCIPYGSMADLDQLLKDCIEYFNLHCIDRILKQEEIKVDHLYAGHQGGAWYRVLINKIVGPGLVSVYIVDFGEYNAMAVEEIKPLPWRFWRLPFQAFKCKLHGIKPVKGTQVWSEGAKLKMKQMAEEKDLVGLVCGKEENGVVSLRLVDTATENDVCLDETLLDLEMAEIIESTS